MGLVFSDEGTFFAIALKDIRTHENGQLTPGELTV
jgi:hypothetical protein